MRKFYKSVTATVLTLAMILQFACLNVASAASVKDWNIRMVNGIDADVFVDGEETYSGNGAMKIVIRTQPLANVYVDITQEISVEKGKTYYVGAMMKTEGSCDADIMIDWGKRYHTEQFGTTYDWRKYEYVYRAEKTGTVLWRMAIGGTGTFWMDDCFFIDSETGENLIKNPNFDTGNSAANSGNGNISKENQSNDEIYKTITTSESFSEDDINKVVGGFKYIPVYRANAINVDGKTDDWENYESIEMPTLSNQYSVYMNDGRLLDAKANCKFAYDDQYLYMMVEVEDDVNYYLYGSGSYWQADSLQFAVSNMTENYGSEIGLAVNPETNELDVWGLGTTPTPVLAKGNHEGTKTVYEFAYPWDVKFSKRPDQIKFDILLNDNDGDGRRYCAELAPGISSGKTNAKFPVMEFVDSEKEWYGWIESASGTELLIDTEYSFDYYVVNKSDSAKEIKVNNTLTGETTEVSVAPHSGIRRNFVRTFNDENTYNIAVTFESGDVKTTSEVGVNVQKPMATAEETKEAIATLESQVKELQKLIKKCEKNGISTDYETMHCGILESFVGYLQEDLSKGIFERVNYTVRATNKIYNEDKAALNAYLSGNEKPREVPKYLHSKVKFNDVSFLADVELPDGTVEERPVFFQGYGHNLNTALIQNMQSVGSNTTQLGVGLREVMSTIPNWTMLNVGKPEGEYGYDTEVVKEGKQSFKVVYTAKEKAETYYTMTQAVPTIPGHSYTLTGWIKAQNNQSSLSIYSNSWRNGDNFKGDFDWKEVSMGGVASGDTMTVRFVFQGPADGIWLDDFKFVDNDDPETNLLKNGNFEVGDGEMPVYDSESGTLLWALESFDAARDANVYVDFGLGPHDFLEDVIKKNNIEMTDCVFIKFNINAPVAKTLMEEYIHKIMEVIKENEDVVQSICLTNEPAFQSKNCGDFYNEQWWQFLRERYNNNIDELNKSYETNFTDFTEVDQYATKKQPAKNYDYFLFNSQIFADWHQWLADLVHETCPDMPVYSKMYAYVLRQPSNMLYFNVDAEKFSEFADINGCDAYDFMDQHEALEKEMWYDFLKSLKDTPIIDSENHNVPDLDTGWNNDDIATHMGRDIYLGAVHGRGNAANWILSRNVAGQAPFRPGGMVEMGDAGYDLNRLAYEITALQKEPREAAVLYTNSSTLNNDSSLQSIYQAYKAIAMNGKNPRFVVESQLEKMDNYKILIVPNLPYAQPKTLEKIAEYIKNGGKVIVLGQNTLSKTDKNLDVDEQVRKFIFDNSIVLDWVSSSDSTADNYVEALDSAYTNLLKEEGLVYAELIDTETGKKAENVEWLLGVYNGKLIVNVANMRNKKGVDAKLKLIVNGKEVEKLYDLRAAKEVSGEFTVDAYDVTTYSVEIDNPFFDTYNHWSDEEIAELYGKGLIAGISESRFNTDSNITRAEFLALTVRACKLPEAKYFGQISDVASDKWYANDVARALSAGIISNENFRPDDAITREEMCNILVKAYESKNGAVEFDKAMKFTDEKDIKNADDVLKMSSLEIVKGYEDGSFRPNGTATRAEAAAMINRFDNVINAE